jgi:hypothetical protein
MVLPLLDKARHLKQVQNFFVSMIKFLKLFYQLIISALLVYYLYALPIAKAQ